MKKQSDDSKAKDKPESTAKVQVSPQRQEALARIQKDYGHKPFQSLTRPRRWWATENA